MKTRPQMGGYLRLGDIMIKKGVVAISSMALLASVANAARTFQFDYIGLNSEVGLVYGDVNFITNDRVTNVDGLDALVVTGISGRENGVAITGLSPSFPEHYDGADNYLFLTLYSPLFSSSGVSFSFADGRYSNLFSEEYRLYEFTATNLMGDEGVVNTRFLTSEFFETTVAVPEPTSWTLMLGGFGAVGGILRRRQKSGYLRLEARGRT